MRTASNSIAMIDSNLLGLYKGMKSQCCLSRYLDFRILRAVEQNHSRPTIPVPTPVYLITC